MAKAKDKSADSAPVALSSLADLAAAPYNPRSITAKALAGLGYSLAEFGDISGIVWNHRTGQLVAGHQRVRSLRQQYGDLRIEAGEVLTPEGHRFAVRVVDWPEAKEKAANVAANAPTISGDFTADLPALVDEIARDFPEAWEAMDFGEIVVPGEVEAVEPHEVEEDEAPPVDEQGEPDSRQGEVYQLGPHRLLCGDSTDAAAVALLMGDDTASALCSDPPYGIGLEYGEHDDSSNESNLALVQAVFAHAPAVRVWTPGKMNLGRDLAWNPKAKVLCWHKGFAQAGSGLGGASTWEPVLVVGAKNATLPDDYLHYGTDRLAELKTESGKKHPCPKPVALYAHLVKHLTQGIVYEPFCGSGTTLIACAELGRRCVAIEIDPRYCDVIRRRWTRWAKAHDTDPGPGALD